MVQCNCRRPTASVILIHRQCAHCLRLAFAGLRQTCESRRQWALCLFEEFIMPKIPLNFKKCTRCQQIFPATPEFFYRSKNYSSGLLPRCKFCERERSARYDATNREKVRAYYRNYRATHIERQRDWERQWSLNNKDKVSATQERYHQRHPGKSSELRRRAHKNHPETARTAHLRRRARERGLPDKFTSQDWLFALNYWNNSCTVCGCIPGKDPNGPHVLAADHWIPLANPNCPGTVTTNIVPLCHGKRGCNASKANRDPFNWLARRFGEEQATEIVARVEAYFAVVRSTGYEDAGATESSTEE